MSGRYTAQPQAVHEVRIDCNSNTDHPSELVGTFTGQVPRAGELLSHTLLREPENKRLAELPRYHDAVYKVTEVIWAITDEAAGAKATVLVGES